MLPSISNSLILSRPELANALGAIRNWVIQHPYADYIPPKSLAKNSDRVEPFELATALNELVKLGIFQQRYRLETVDGQILQQSFHSPSAIPDTIEDDFDSRISKDDCKIVSVYEEVP